MPSIYPPANTYKTNKDHMLDTAINLIINLGFHHVMSPELKKWHEENKHKKGIL